MVKCHKLSASVAVAAFSLTYILPLPVYAGTLEFEGVPVDITTADSEDLVIVPGTGGNVQIGDLTGTNSFATGNDDMHVTGILEVDGMSYLDGGLTSGANVLPGVDVTYNLGSSSKYWNKLFVKDIYATNIPKINGVDYAWPSAQGAAGTFLRNDGTGTLTWAAGAGGGASLPAVDTTSVVEGSVDATKEVRFEVDGLTTGTTRVMTVPDRDGTLVVASAAPTNGQLLIGKTDGSYAVANITAGSNVTVTNGDGTIQISATTGSALPAVDSTSIVEGSVDATKEMRFEADGITTGTTRVVTLQDVDGTMYVSGGQDVSLADGGTGASLVDPDADKIMFWDDSLGAMTFLDLGSNLSITGTTLNATGSNLPVVDTTSVAEGSVDPTKEVRFEVDGLTTGTTRVLTVPDADGTLAISATSPVALSAMGDISVADASGSSSGVVNTAAQTFAGAKTFSSQIVGSAGVSVAANQAYTGAGAVTLSSGGAGGLTLDSATNTLTVASSDTAFTASGVTSLTLGADASITNSSGKLFFQPAGVGTVGRVVIGAGDGGSGSATPDILVLDKTSGSMPAGANGALLMDAAGKLNIYENGAWKVLCNTTDAACGAGSGSALSAIQNAAGANSISNGDHAQAWNWSLTTAGKSGFAFGESAAAINGVGSQYVLETGTSSGSTAGPLKVTSQSADVGDIVFDLASAGDLLISDNGTPFATFNDDGSILLSGATELDDMFTVSEMTAPATSGADKGRIYFDATANKFKVSENDGAYVDMVPLGGTAAANASYITQVPESGLSGEQALSALGTGLVKNTTGTGVLSIAAAGTDYLAPAAIGVTVQAYDADLDTWATKTAPTGAIVGISDTQTLTNKTLLDSTTTYADDVDVTKAFKFQVAGVTASTTRVLTIPDVDGTLYVTGGTDVSVSDGGTGASDAATARSNLGLVIGTNVQAWDTDLDGWATRTPPSGTIIGTSDVQTLTNKSLSDSTTYIIDEVDATKRLNFDVTGNSGATTGVLATQFTTAKTITFPDATGTVAVSASTPLSLSATGDLSVAAAGAASSGVVTTAAQTLAGSKTFTGDATLIKPSSDSVTAVQVQPSGSTTPAFNVDTTNSRVGIGNAAPISSLDVTGTGATAIVRQTGGFTGTSYLRLGSSAANDYYGAYMMYNGSTNSLNIGSHPFSDTNLGSDLNYLTLATQTGRLGLGTTDPMMNIGTSAGDYALATYGYHVMSTNNAAIVIEAGNGASRLHWSDDNAAVDQKNIIAELNTGKLSFSNLADDLTVSTANILVVDGVNGRVGVGANDPDSILDVSGAFSLREIAAPATSGADRGRIYFDSTADKFRVSENDGTYVDLVPTGGAATSGASYITQVSESGLSGEQALASLGTGLLKNTTGTGVLSVASAGTDYYAPAGTDVALADGGTGASLVDPAADRLMGWDDTDNAVKFLTIGSGLSYNPTTDTLTATNTATGDVIGPSSSTDNALVRFDGITGKLIQDYTSGAPTVSDTGSITLNSDINVVEISAPAASVANTGRIYFDATADKFKVSESTGGYIDLVPTGGAAAAGGSYITQVPESNLTGEQALSTLSTGLMKVTTTTGVVSSVTDSAGLAGSLSDEVGSAGGGVAVFSNAPTIDSPVIKGEAVVALTPGGSISTNASLGNIFTIEYNAAATLATPTNPTNGQKCIWRFKNTDSVPHKLTLNTSGAGAFRFGNTIEGTTNTLAGKTDYIGAVYNLTDDRWDVIAYAKGYV